MRTLVTGATGYVGSRLVTALLGEGHDVVVATRHPESLARFGWVEDVAAVTLDANNSDSAHVALAEAGDVDVLYYLVHGIGQPGFRDADNAAAANVANAAKASGVKRIVYLGGFVPDKGDGGALSEHLASRAEVADALTVQDGPELVWLGAAMILGAGSTSFEMLRYVGDRFFLIPMPEWVDNPMDPISIRDVLYYLVAAGNSELVPAGSYDISGPDSTTYHDLILDYTRIAGIRRAGVPVRGVDTGVVSWGTSLVLPVPGGLAADLVESLDFPMQASDDSFKKLVEDPPGGLTSIDDAIALSLSKWAPAPGQRARGSAPPGRQRSRVGRRRRAADPSDRPPGDAHSGAADAGPCRRRTQTRRGRGTHRTRLRRRRRGEGALGVTQDTTAADTAKPSLVQQLKQTLVTECVLEQEPPSVIRRRRVVVAVVLVVGASVLGLSLTREPGDPSFYWLTLALAATWAGGALLSGPLHLGGICYWGRNQRPVISGTIVGLGLGAVFIVGALIAREIPVIADFIRGVLEFANAGGNLPLVVVITVVNGLAEEMFFRGALYTALGRFYPVLVSTVLYIVATLASGNPMLGFAAVILGVVCAWERRATGGVLAPMLTHFFWGLVMVLALPPLFGV